MRRGALRLSGLLLALLLAAGCAPAAGAGRTCNVVFEDNEEVFFYRQVYPVSAGDDLTVSLGIPAGRRISDVSYGRWTLSGRTGYSENYEYYTLILHEVRYPAVIRLVLSPANTTEYLPGTGSGEAFTVVEDSPRLFPNALPWDGRFRREGCLAVGWNTAPDGSGTHVGFGSQPLRTETALTLYPEYLPCSPEADFDWEERDGGAAVTGWRGTGDLVVPAELGGLPVTALAAGAFGDAEVERAAFPPSLRTVEDGAFRSLRAGDLYLFDTLEEVSDASFGQLEVARLHINAARPPVYCGSYFDTLSEKYARLRSLAGRKKLALFAGSSARFGYDSPMLEEAFPDYQVVNLGVYAYSNMLPQALLLAEFLEPGDVVLSSPELDAIDTQFCGSTALSWETFALLESNYDLFALLDCRTFTGVFGAFAEYQESRRWMGPRSYSDVPAQYDEDGNRVDELSYNRWGDYILYRENNESRQTFGIKRAFFNASHITGQDWAGLNAVYDLFAAKGALPLFTWSPRSRISLSEDSTETSIAELERLARERLHAEIISPIGDALIDPLYFYGTDNHLSTEGAKLRTRQIIEDLRPVLEGA